MFVFAGDFVGPTFIVVIDWLDIATELAAILFVFDYFCKAGENLRVGDCLLTRCDCRAKKNPAENETADE